MPREGTETLMQATKYFLIVSINLEIRCPERGRKLIKRIVFFGYSCIKYLEIRCPERGRKLLCQLIVCISVVTDLK